jgi:hypothetical protein
MAKDRAVVLLVHGMGTSSRGDFKKEFIQAVADGAANFGLTVDVASKVDYQEFNYSEFFDIVRKQFADNAEARRKGFGFLAGKGFEDKLVTQLTSFEKNFGKDEFYYTHWLDVVLYGTMYFGEHLRVEFIKAFEKLVRKYKHRNVHIVCHSLGTALVHDSLAKYYRAASDPFDSIPDKPLGQFNIASLWTLANVSRLLHILNGQSDPMTSTVQTGNAGCVNRIVNARNKCDPFTWYKTYNRQMADMVDVEIDTIRKVNTHDFYEYVTEPNITRGLLQIVYGVQVTPAQFAAGVKAHRKTDLGTQVQDIRDLVEEAVNDASIDNLASAIVAFKRIRVRIEELRAQLEVQP